MRAALLAAQLSGVPAACAAGLQGKQHHLRGNDQPARRHNDTRGTRQAYASRGCA
ncbi:hypothetical protein [Xanthomonas campestris]|uniref:hypothetical protein n=1 Tax=Xanthomonas campestris TaxID=339 RepID=UPI0013015C8A|nr:hypothetical protein [Xanthomonas campestris]MCF8825046.1 hypothetical protein [Xanthomonas campestris pv. raphani]MEA9840034.1 hypothetical protein [Xanthomonas campestris pv. raphani]MEA9874744.1 hypothetical protein [Xanthomonas campestris pv. raphani]MEA9894041.1 hypothetical protein [Xanthomonas campestris pv. raphani]MEA9932701.1 hypothetical protein [Xanthomonas campestris pv. raphani]